jgi:hypothetical protein
LNNLCFFKNFLAPYARKQREPKVVITALLILFVVGAVAWYYTPKYLPSPYKKPVPEEKAK